MADAGRARDIDDAAFGVIYGTITVMGVLAATDSAQFDPLTTGLTLFVTVLAVALAKTYADLASKALSSGEHHSARSIGAAWRHSRTTLIAANGPTLAMLVGAAGAYAPAVAMGLAQACAMALLLFYGWRIGWRISERVLPSAISALAMGAGGLALTALKHAVH
ncbi:MAG: hypothetical protein AAGA87_12690 [Pseudomonadota bacterium]